MSRLAVVITGSSPQIVQTWVKSNTRAPAPDNCEYVAEDALLPGWHMVDEPPAPVPERVTRWQARRWLVDHGYTPDEIETQLLAISDPLERARALVDWRDAPYVERAHLLVEWVGQLYGLSSAQLDNAFREMAKLGGEATQP